MIINHNINSINANRTLKYRDVSLGRNSEKLSTGMKINRAGDDASGLAVSEKMRSQIRGLDRAELNAQDGVSLLQTTEGYLTSISDLIQRVRELSVQSANGIYEQADRDQIQVEVNQLLDEIDNISEQGQFNNLKLFSGRFAAPTGENAPEDALYLHLGANMDERERIYIEAMSTISLGLRDEATGEAMSTQTLEEANRSISVLDNALKKVLKQRADLGGYQARVEFTMKNLSVGAENLQAAESRIRDVNMALEMSDFIKNQILQQSNIAVLSQTNNLTRSVLTLLQ